MIQVNELRVGNIIAKGTKVFTIKCATELVTIQRMPVPFSPIELTDEWLVRFGFVHKNGYGYKFNNIHLWNTSDNFEFTGWRYKPVQIKHVHQLQNLYFALTGEELKPAAHKN